MTLGFVFVCAGQPIIAFECKHVSMRLTLWVPTVDEVVEAAVSAMHQLGVERSYVIGHSYGSTIASRMVQLHRQQVRIMKHAFMYQSVNI